MHSYIQFQLKWKKVGRYAVFINMPMIYSESVFNKCLMSRLMCIGVNALITWQRIQQLKVALNQIKLTSSKMCASVLSQYSNNLEDVRISHGSSSFQTIRYILVRIRHVYSLLLFLLLTMYVSSLINFVSIYHLNLAEVVRSEWLNYVHALAYLHINK